MKTALVISAGAHVLFFWGLVWLGRTASDALPSAQVYTVSLVGLPGKLSVEPTRRAPESPEESDKKGSVKTERAPSTEQMAPKGNKRSAGEPEPKPQAKSESQTSESEHKQGGQGTRLEVPFPFPDYLRDLLGMVDAAWQKPILGSRQLLTTVYFRIQRDGSVTELRVEKSSGVFVFDRAALAAVSQAGPLPPLPEAFRGDYLGVHFDFEN